MHTHASVTRRQQIFGYSEEELRVLLTPMANTGGEALGSMGTDTPIAALSDKPRLLFDYFSQLFAQVTNPPLDAIREELVTSLSGTIGPEANLLEPAPASCRQVVLPFPVISNDDLAKIRHINRDGDMPGFIMHVSRGLYEVEGGGAALARRIDEICVEVSTAIADGARIIVLSDRHSTADLAPIPSLLLTGAVHHHLVREKTRTQVGLLVEAGDVREVHHVALLVGYGAAAVNPYLAMESVEDLAREAYYVKVDPEKAVANLIKGLGKGVLKVMSKMGVSTVASYTGAQDLRGRRPLAGRRRQVLHRDDVQARRHRARDDRRGGVAAPRVGVPPRRHRAGAPRARPSAASTSGVARASRTCSTRRRSSGSSTRPARAATRSSSSTPTRVDEQSERLMTLRGLFRSRTASHRSQPDQHRRGRAGLARSSSASRPARCPTAPSARRRTRPSRSR